MYCEQDCSLFPAVPAVAGEAKSASAHAAPAPAGRSPSVSQGIGGHPESESVIQTQCQQRNCLRTKQNLEPAKNMILIQTKQYSAAKGIFNQTVQCSMSQ